MAKAKKFGYDRQDAVIAKFSRDARSTNKNSAVALAIREGKKRKVALVDVDEDGEEIRISYNFLTRR